MKNKPQSPVQLVIGTVYRESMKATGHSWTRLNGVLRGTMRNLIAAGVKFEVDDVKKALADFSGHYWDSHESWYSSACGAEHGDGGGNLSAAIAIEVALGRQPFIWAERTKTPTRLYVGADFTWKGERVTVTSFDDRKHTLTACSYTQERETDLNKVGSRTYAYDGYRVIEALKKYDDGSVAIRYSAKTDEECKIKKRFTISNEDMAAARADYDQRRRKHEKAIAAAETLEQVDAAAKAAADEGKEAYRHFDLEILNKLIAEQRAEITDGFPKKLRKLANENRKEEEAEWERGRPEREQRQREYEARRKANAAEDIKKWLAGDTEVRPYFEQQICLRIKGEFVECSNGNKVSLDAAFKTLPLVHRYRGKGWEQNGQVHDVDAFRLEKIDKSGVQIGCTLISWEEVDRFTPILKAARRKAKA